MVRQLSKTEYNTTHQWNLRHWVKSGVCDFCKGITKTQWSNKSGEYIKGDRNDWQELCFSCHFEYDRGVPAAAPNYKTRTVPKTYISVIDGKVKQNKTGRQDIVISITM